MKKRDKSLAELIYPDLSSGGHDRPEQQRTFREENKEKTTAERMPSNLPNGWERRQISPPREGFSWEEAARRIYPDLPSEEEKRTEQSRTSTPPQTQAWPRPLIDLDRPATSSYRKPSSKDDEGNSLDKSLGVYRGREDSMFQDDPVIFDQESPPPHPTLGMVTGALTPDKGLNGTLRSGSYEQGKTRLVIYGNPETGKASSWTLLEWAGTGKMTPNTNAEIYGWRRMPNAKAALSRYGVEKLQRQFLYPWVFTDDEKKRENDPKD